MFGNKYHGDSIAKEFYKLVELKKIASAEQDDSEMDNPAHDVENYVDEPAIDPQRFLNSLDEVPDITEKIDSDIEELTSMVEDSNIEDDCGDSAMSPDMSYLLDHKASEVLHGLGKIAGSLRKRNENFAADIVEVAATSIKNDMVKEASRKLETVGVLNKIASDISKNGDQFTADIVRATILKIKNT